MPFVHDHIQRVDKNHATGINFSFNDREAQGRIFRFPNWTEPHYKHVGGSAGVSTVVTFSSLEYLVDDYFISVVCEDVEAFVIHQLKNLTHFSLNTLETDGDQKMLEIIINRMCRCLESSLQSRTQKLKVEQFSLSVLEINQAASAVNLLDRKILQVVTVHLPLEDQVFTADDFIPLIEGQGRQRLDLAIQLHMFSVEVLEEVKKLLTSTSKQLNSITINYKTIDKKCYELIVEAEHSSDGNTAKFSIDHADDPIEEMTMFALSDNKRDLNIFEVPSIMQSIASHLECPEIQSLRKVSRNIRDCVDYIKPDPHILVYFMLLKNSSSVVIEEMMNGKIEAHYTGSLEQNAVRIVNDFDLNTRHQKSRMNWLYIEMDEEIWKLKEGDDSVRSKVFKLLRDVLVSRTSPLKAKTLTFVFHWQCLMMDILPYLDAEILENIHIHRIEGIDEKCVIELDNISKTEQWSKAIRLRINDFTVRMSIQDLNILNFKRIDIILKTMSAEDITYCRKNLPQSSIFLEFKIRIKNCSTADFLASLGEPYRVVNNIKYIWYFRIENTQHYLHVVFEQVPLQIEGRLQFAKIHQNKTPFF